MAEPLELPDGWPPESLERLVQVRLDIELERSLSVDRYDYARAREKMPRDVRIREVRVLQESDR